ncbi:MAG: gamma-glutamyl-gamma-aminobutyrate hydrolase family protein [Desulfobacterales bacterium]
MLNNKTMIKKLLLINCYREKAEEKIKVYHTWLNSGSAAKCLELDVVTCRDADPLPESKKFSAIIVSGSQKMVSSDEVESGLREFLKSNRRPLLGICYGHQALASVFGGLVKKDKQTHNGDEEIILIQKHKLFSGFPSYFKMAESHEEIVVNDRALASNFFVPAASASCLTESIIHRKYQLCGVQFHPERSGELGIKLLVNFLKMIKD